MLLDASAFVDLIPQIGMMVGNGFVVGWAPPCERGRFVGIKRSRRDFPSQGATQTIVRVTRF